MNSTILLLLATIVVRTEAGGSAFNYTDTFDDTYTFEGECTASETPHACCTAANTGVTCDYRQFGSWDCVESSGALDCSSATGSVIYQGGSLDGTSGYVCVESVTSNNCGPKFRASADDSNESYIVRANSTTNIVWRHCSVASCTTIETDTNGTFNANDSIGVVYSGEDASTVVTWHIFNGTNCPNCDATDCDTSTWAAADESSGTMTTDPDTATYPELNTNRHTGLYCGGSSTNNFSGVYAGDE